MPVWRPQDNRNPATTLACSEDPASTNMDSESDADVIASDILDDKWTRYVAGEAQLRSSESQKNPGLAGSFSHIQDDSMEGCPQTAEMGIETRRWTSRPGELSSAFRQPSGAVHRDLDSRRESHEASDKVVDASEDVDSPPLDSDANGSSRTPIYYTSI